MAVSFGGEELTYVQLNSRANQLAYVLRTLGVSPNVMVGVCMERSLEMVVALYGILKAGGAYVPMDPTYPTERLNFMVSDARVPVLLTQERFLPDLQGCGARLMCLDTGWHEMANQSTENPERIANPKNFAYVIYTSGSTGTPKGAINSHKGIVNRLLWMQEAYQLNAQDKVLQKTPFSFDVSVWEFFWPLMFGARLVVAKPEGHKDSAYLLDLIARERITTLHFVPSMLEIFLEEKSLERCQSLRHVVCSGEALPYDLQVRFFARMPEGIRLHNLYGPTEAAVDVTYYECQPDSSIGDVPIGRPIANTRIYILDPCGNPVPIGVPGELHIGGIQVGLGYWNRPELTAEKFVPDPFSNDPDARLYKTGDLALFLPDGNIKYLGRMDFQVKIRGLRIEIGEIENVLRSHPSIRDAVVLVREDERRDKKLVAYVTKFREQEFEIGNIRKFLAKKLPAYMLPSFFVLLENMPLMPNGKVDRRALAVPDLKREDSGATYVPPETPLQEKIATVWSEILRLERVGLHDNFFELGGHSLLAIQIIWRIREMFQLELPMRAMFDYPTVAEISKICEALLYLQDNSIAPVGREGEGRVEIEI